MESNVQLFNCFCKQQNLGVSKVINSNLSPSKKLNSLQDLIFVEYKCNHDLDTIKAFYYDLYRHGIVFGCNLADIVNKDKIDNRIGGKIIYHGEIYQHKDYKLIRVKRIYGKDSHMFLFKATDLTNHDVRQIGHDMINNITFNNTVCFNHSITKADIKMFPCISYKHIDTITINGAKWYWYVCKASINYSNKLAFTHLLDTAQISFNSKSIFLAPLRIQENKTIRKAINYIRVLYNQVNHLTITE